MNNFIQHYPEIQHFDNIHEVLTTFQKFDNFRQFPFETMPGFAAPKDKFEKIRLKDNSFILVPADAQFTLFRGQNKFYENCKPTIYRSEQNELDIFINQLRLNEFFLLLNDNPIIKHVFKPEKFKVDYWGLAQHYGLKTDLLDFTSDIQVALFFSTCRYDSNLDKYFPYTEDTTATGYLYVYPLYRGLSSDKNEFKDFFCNKLQVIGLQPFERPAAQKGFSLKLSEHECLEALSYSFTYNKNDSKQFYEKFNKGDFLWVQDILAEKTKQINFSNSYSFDAFNLTVKSVGTKYKKSSYYQKVLNSNGFSLLQREKLPWSFTKNELDKIAEYWDTEGSNMFWDSVVSRSNIIDNVKYPEISINQFTELLLLLLLLRTFMAEDNTINKSPIVANEG